MKKYGLVTETLEYRTSEDATNTDERYLTAGSKNVIIDQNRKVRVRNGNTRVGNANTALTGVRSAVTWTTSTTTDFELRVYDDELEVYLQTVDSTALNAHYRVLSGISTTAKVRFASWYSNTEKLDLLVFVQGNENLYAWGGGVCVVDSVTGTTITKKGTDTFAQARFFTASNKTIVNVRTGTEYTYTGGESSTTLTGIVDTTGIVSGDVLVQKVITTSNKPASNRTNHNIFQNENQVFISSEDDELVYISKNTDYTDFSYSSPRVAGEGGLLTLDDPAQAFGLLEEKVIIFAGKSSAYQVTAQEIAVGSTLAETLSVKKYQTGENQAAYNQETLAQINNSIVYLSHEPSVREIQSLSQLQGGATPKTLSNPIKPDIDAETWTNACAYWYKSAYYLSAPTNGRLFILEYREDADGKLRRFWQPPQTMFIGALSVLDGELHGHSSVVPETYFLFDPEAYSDINSNNDKIAYQSRAVFAYRNYGARAVLKNFDEYYIEGELSPSTQLTHTLYYDYGGNTGTVTTVLDGADTDIIEETLERASLGQESLGINPLGGLITTPENTAKFRVIIELAREDFFQMQDIFTTDDTDKYWAIIARGSNAKLSSRQPINKKK